MGSHRRRLADMAQTVGDFLVERLHAWGVRTIFGYPGDGINGVFGREWANPHWIVCVFNNEDLNQVTWEQRVMEGDPKFEASQDIPNVPYHRFAELIGLKGIFVDRPADLGSAWEQALSSDRPVVLEVKTDPEVPPLPPHITFQQAMHYSEALLKGDPREGGMIKGTVRQVLSSILPGHRTDND
jgi:pyruvate dehydrogenase (quinone)